MFINEPLIDFTVANNRAQFQSVIHRVAAAIAAHRYISKPIVSGREISDGEIFVRIDPSNGSTPVGKVIFASEAHLATAIQDLRKGAPAWEATPLERRAEILVQIGKRMRDKKEELAALMIFEVGKPWKEADADVAEAIDFCDYYAAEALANLSPRKMGQLPGEENSYFYQARGICGVIAPWNFPLAIACGMTVAALVTGNAVILKPAEQSSLIAYEFAKIVLEAGVPSSAFAFLPGRGEIIGRGITHSPHVDMICFTGSKAVGLEILAACARVQPEQHSIKKCVTELGGKNAIIVDEDADLDEAVKGILYSAFGFAGQKCSACSRVIAVGDSSEPLLRRLGEAASDLLVGEAQSPDSYLGPVIDEESCSRILETIAKGEKNAKLLFKGKTPQQGNFVPPTIFKEVSPSDSLWREEIFGPVIACTSAKDFDEALRLANDSEYALTGGVFSRSPAHIERAKREFKVGNLYLNRGCTGAMVYRQPFGGFKMSGIGSKAGGPDYLLQFVEPRTVTENTMRRGFAPEL